MYNGKIMRRLTLEKVTGSYFVVVHLFFFFSSRRRHTRLQGDWSSDVCSSDLLGVGIAGTYMPGLRLLSDHVTGPKQSRSIAFYTASFGVGTALSLALAGAVAPRAGWKAAFLVSAIGPLIAETLVIALLGALQRPDAAARVTIFVPFASWGTGLRHRDVAGYIVGDAVHCLELFGSRSWMVAFLTYSAGLQAARFPWRAQSLAAVVNLMAGAAALR